VKSAHEIIIRPHITERSVAMSMGDEASAKKRLLNEARAAGKKPELPSDQDLVHKYTFVVANDANKIEIKRAVEQFYNAGTKKAEDKIVVTGVHTISVKGKTRRVGARAKGKRPDWKKAVITLAKGQRLEDYGV